MVCERRILHVEDLKSGRTIVSVTHRLETVKTADLIVVVDGGRVIETGSFDQLLSRGDTRSVKPLGIPIRLSSKDGA